MSIFFKFVVESGEPQSVKCGGMDMSLADLKLAIKDQRRFKNVTDFDLQVENGQTKYVYTDETELIPKNTTVMVKRMPMPRGEKKTWRAEKPSGGVGHGSAPGLSGGDLLSSQVVTSTSEEGRMEAVLAASGVEYGKDSWEKIYRPRAPRPLAGEAVKAERRYAYGIPSNMLVTAKEGDNAAKVDRFGSLKLTAVEQEGYSNEKVESHTWLEEEDEGKVVAPPKEEVVIPKDLQCPFCSELLEAAILLPCCVAAACDECARNSLIESDHSCQLCQEKDVSPNDLIPNPLLRKKVLGFRNKAAGREDAGKPARLTPVPQLLTGNSVLPAEIMLQRQREMEEEKRLEEKRLVEAVLANINTMDSEASPDNLPVSDTPGEGVESATVKEASAQDNSNTPEEEVAARPVSSIEKSRPSSPHQDQDPTSPPSERTSSPQTKSSPPQESQSVSREPSESREVRSSSPQRRSSPSIPGPSETSQPSSPRPESTPPPSTAPPAPDSTASPAPPDTSSQPGQEEAYSIQSMSAPVPGQTIQTTYNNSYNTYYPGGYYPPSDYSLPPPGYPHYYPPTQQYDYDYGKGKTFSYDERSEDDRWRRDRDRYRDRDRDRDRYKDRPGYSNYMRAHGLDDRRRGRNRSRSSERDRHRDRHRSRDRDRHRDRRERSERSSRTRSKERKMSRDSKSPPGSPKSDKRREKSKSRSKKERDSQEKDTEEGSGVEYKSSGEGEHSKEAQLEKKEEARKKLKDLISKNRDRAKDVTKKKEKELKASDSDKDVDLRAMLQQRKRKGEERGREAEKERAREKREREKESDGDWHCGDQECRFINFKKNNICKQCGKPPPIEPVFWDIPPPDIPEKERRKSTSRSSDRRRKSSPDERRSPSGGRRRGRDKSQDSSSSGKDDYKDFEATIKEDPGLLKGDLLNFSCPDTSLDYSPSSLANIKVSSPADLLSTTSRSHSGGGEDETRSRHSSRTSGSRPGSRSQVTSFLDDIGDSFEDESTKVQSKVERSRTNSPFSSKEEDFKKPLDFEEKGETEDAFEKKVKMYTNDSDGDGEAVPKEGDTLSLEDLSSSNTKLEDISSQDLSSSQDDSMTSQNDSKPESQLDKSIKTESEADPKYAWMDRSRTSEEFELSLEINDKDFLETVKKEYRSSSPSWANQKFKFPVKKEKSEKKIDERVEEKIDVEDDKNIERSVSVRKRMQDEIKKEKDEKAEKVDIKEEKVEAKKVEEPNTNTQDSLELLKMKGESLRRKERQYRSSKDDLNTSNDGEGSKEERKREHRSGSKTHEKEDERDRRRRDERQRERDKKERERNERIREEDEERRRRRKIEEERRKMEDIRRQEEEKRREKKRIEDREREEREKRKADEEKRKRAEEESRRKREKLEEEKRRLDEERREIERKRELDRKREEKITLERRIRENRKRSRSKSPGEQSVKVRKEKQLAVGDLRARLEDKKKVSKTQEKKSKPKSKKKKKKESSSSSSSDSSSSSSTSESEDSDNPAEKILKDKKLLKKILELATSGKKKKKTKKKKKASQPSPEKLGTRRVIMAGRDILTMQLSQDDSESKQKREEVKKRSSRSPVKKRTRPSGGGEGVSKKVRGGSASNSDQETIQINIRNSPALERMNKNKAGDTSDDEQVDKILKNRPRRSPSPSPTKSESGDSDKDAELEEGEIESEEEKAVQ